jgi:ATP-binding cassette subfamily C protein CydD
MEARAQVSWVPQKPYLFNASVVENIRMGCPAAAIEEVIAAARQAQAHDFIQTLPQGYETLIGERGARLSSGQAQRLVLARAFLKNAPLLILDEATANLDVELEAQLQETASNLIRDRSVLMIAHRLGSVYQADKILVFSHGKILQAGTHAELVQQAGLYRNLVSAYVGDGGMQFNE